MHFNVLPIHFRARYEEIYLVFSPADGELSWTFYSPLRDKLHGKNAAEETVAGRPRVALEMEINELW